MCLPTTAVLSTTAVRALQYCSCLCRTTARPPCCGLAAADLLRCPALEPRTRTPSPAHHPDPASGVVLDRSLSSAAADFALPSPPPPRHPRGHGWQPRRCSPRVSDDPPRPPPRRCSRRTLECTTTARSTVVAHIGLHLHHDLGQSGARPLSPALAKQAEG
jgi:hypothetical protein